MNNIDNERVEGVDLNQIEFPVRCRRIGPTLPVADYRVVAGLLCDRHGGGSASIKRVLHMQAIFRHQYAPYVKITAYRDFSDPASKVIPVMRAAADELVSRGYVSGTPMWGYTDDKKLQLTQYGSRKVMEVWFRGCFNALDAVHAGATWDLNKGELRW